MGNVIFIEKQFSIFCLATPLMFCLNIAKDERHADSLAGAIAPLSMLQLT